MEIYQPRYVSLREGECFNMTLSTTKPGVCDHDRYLHPDDMHGLLLFFMYVHRFKLVWTYQMIMIKSELRRILKIVANLSQNDVKKDVLETDIISQSGLSDLEVRDHLNELEWLHLVKEVLFAHQYRRRIWKWSTIAWPRGHCCVLQAWNFQCRAHPHNSWSIIFSSRCRRAWRRTRLFYSSFSVAALIRLSESLSKPYVVELESGAQISTRSAVENGEAC